MGTEILKSFGTLQSELEQARSSLKGVDDNIKRLIGRDPSELLYRPGLKRVPPVEENRGRVRISYVTSTVNRGRNLNHENDEPLAKRRSFTSATSVFKRLSERPSHYEEDLAHQPQKQLISKVIVTPKEVPSRQEALAAQSTDEKSKARNKRMFGALLGTLQKFQQEETKLKPKEEKRAQLEKKIEEHEIKEKAEIKKERQELFFNRKKKQAEIKMIELKMSRMKEYALWEERQKPRMNFVQTKAKPHIHFLPRKMNEANRALLESCKSDVEKMIDKKRQEVFDELQHIEERMKKNFEPKKIREKAEDGQAVQEEDVRNAEHDNEEVPNVFKEETDEKLAQTDSVNENCSENIEQTLSEDTNHKHEKKMDTEINGQDSDKTCENVELDSQQSLSKETNENDLSTDVHTKECLNK